MVALWHAMIFLNALIADTWLKRVCGWMGKCDFKQDDALFFPHCRLVHTFFMRRPIDVVFLDREKKVVAVRSLAPWRVSPFISTASGCLELPVNRAAELGLVLGEMVNLNIVDIL